MNESQAKRKVLSEKALTNRMSQWRQRSMDYESEEEVQEGSLPEQYWDQRISDGRV